jgi:hypothetical protein
VKVGAVGDSVAHVDANAEANTTVVWLITIIRWHLLLHVHCAAHHAIDAVERHQQRIAAGLDHLATELTNRRIYQGAPKNTQALQRPASSKPMSRLYPTMSAYTTAISLRPPAALPARSGLTPVALTVPHSITEHTMPGGGKQGGELQPGA